MLDTKCKAFNSSVINEMWDLSFKYRRDCITGVCMLEGFVVSKYILRIRLFVCCLIMNQLLYQHVSLIHPQLFLGISRCGFYWILFDVQVDWINSRH